MITPSKRQGFTKGDPRAIAAGKKGYQVLRLKGLDPQVIQDLERKAEQRGFDRGFEAGRQSVYRERTCATAGVATCSGRES
jgi:hypothetical protein